MLVVVHEIGHFIVARRNGVQVEEFGIFFPPRIWSRVTKQGWRFSINALPLGGFVRLKGESDSATEPHSYGAATLWVKTKILLAGVAMNFLTAFVLLMFIALVGMPQLVNQQFTVKSDTHIIENKVFAGYIIPGSPAANIGLKSNDQLLSITPPNGKPEIITSDTALPKITKSLAGDVVSIKYVQNNQTYTKTVHLLTSKMVAASQKTNNPKGYLGISPSQYTLQRSTWSAPIVAAGLLGQFVALTFHGLAMAVMGLVHGNPTQASSQVTGPVGIFEILKNGSLLGYQFILTVVAIISLSLAIMNVLPIPALDGGKLFVTLVAHSLRKKLTENIEALVYGTGFALLMALVILITIVDVKRNF
jgi:regulator of sigma E protease